MKHSILMTVYDRDELTLFNTFVWIARNEIKDVEVIVVDDGSKIDYSKVRKIAEKCLPVKWIRHEPREGIYSVNGSNNPADAFNVAFEHAQGDNIWAMSSDVMLPTNTLSSLEKRDLKSAVATVRVVDLNSNAEYLGKRRLFPMPWFLGTHRSNWPEKDPWDREYMKGIAFEDNDIAATLCLKTGRLVVDTDITAWHQSHKPVDWNDPGWAINESYTKAKWGGVPFEAKTNPLKIGVVEVAGTLLCKVERRSGAGKDGHRELSESRGSR